MKRLPVVIAIIIVIILVVLILPVGIVKNMRIEVSLVDDAGNPSIEGFSIEREEWSGFDWIQHELAKLQMGGTFTLKAEICDPPSDCDSDSATFSWEGKRLQQFLFVPSFIGERTLLIEIRNSIGIIDSLNTTIEV